MEIISRQNYIKAQTTDISVIGYPGMRRGLVYAKMTSAAGFSRTAGQVAWMYWDTVVADNCNAFNPAAAARLYCRQAGWYLANCYVQVPTQIACEAYLQIHHSHINSFIAYRKRKFGTAGLSNVISITAKAYSYTGDSFYCNFGSSGAISTGTGELNVGFAIWKIA